MFWKFPEYVKCARLRLAHLTDSGNFQNIHIPAEPDRAFGGASFRAGGSTGTALSGHQTIYIFLKMRHDTLVELLLGISACLHKIHISKSGVWRPTRAPVVTDRCERVA